MELELIPRFDFPVFYAVLEKGQFIKTDQLNFLSLLLNLKIVEKEEKKKDIVLDGLHDCPVEKKEGKKKDRVLEGLNDRPSDIVTGKRMPFAAYDAVKKMFDSWDTEWKAEEDTEWKAEEQRTGKKEAMRRLSEIILEEKQNNAARTMWKVVYSRCKVENRNINGKNEYSQKDFEQKKTAYNTIKAAMEKDHKNGDYLGCLAESFRLAFALTEDRNGRRFIDYKNEYTEVWTGINKIIEACCKSPYDKTWSLDAPLRKKLEHASGMSMKHLPKTFYFPRVRFDSGKGNNTDPAAGEDKDTNLETLLQHKDDKAPRKLTEILADNHKEERFCLILGPGGAGKTTLFHECMKTLAGTTDNDPNSLIPIYLDLSAAPDVDCLVYGINGHSTFIRHALYYLVHTERENISLPAVDEWVDLPAANLEELFNGTDATKLCLFLDGLNEVSRSVLPRCGRSAFHMIREEIAGLAAKDKFRIFVTSRTEEVFPSATGTSVSPKLYEICGVEKEAIRDTLKKSRLSEQTIERVLADQRLLETLKRPLFLMMYCQLNETEASTPGEILRLFFHDRRDGLYSIQERNSRIEEAQRRQSGYALRQTFTAEQQAFILDFIIPAFAWKMGDRFYTDVEEIKNVIQSIRKDDSETSVRGNAGIQAFPKYRNPSDPNDLLYNTRSVAQGLRDLGFDSGENEFDFHTMTVQIIDYCVSVGVVEKSDQNIKMPQEVIRDYFACAHVINTFRIAEVRWKTAKETDTEKRQAESFACLCTVLKDKPLNPAVRTLIGEALGEHRNGPYFDEKDKKWHYYTDLKIKGSLRGLIEKMLDICRGRHGEEIGYTVFNLLSVLAEVRPNRDLSGLNLNGIDLQLFNILGTRFSRPGLPATFVDSMIRMYPYCQEDISGMAYNVERGRIITYSSSGMLYEWDENTLVCTDSVQLHKGRILDLKFSADGKSFYTVGKDKQKKYIKCIKEWNAKDYSCRHTAVLHDSFGYSTLTIHPKNKQVFVISSAGITKYPITKPWLTVHVFDKDLTPICPVQKLQPDFAYDCSSDTHFMIMHPIAFCPNERFLILDVSFRAHNNTDMVYFLFELDADGKFTVKARIALQLFSSVTYCENTPYILAEKNGILKKYDIRTQEWSILSDSFDGTLTGAYYNDCEKKCILCTENKMLITDLLDLLQNSTEIPHSPQEEILWCDTGPYIGLQRFSAVKIWNIKSSYSQGHLIPLLAKYTSMDVTEDGKHLITIFDNQAIMIFDWDEDTGKYICSKALTEKFDRFLFSSLLKVWWTKEGNILVQSFSETYFVNPNTTDKASDISSDYLNITLNDLRSDNREKALLVRLLLSQPVYDKDTNRIQFTLPNEDSLTLEYKDGRFQKISETMLPQGSHQTDQNSPQTIQAAGHTFTLQEDGSIEIRDTASDTVLQTIPAISDLLIQGVDFSCLKDSGITERDLDLLQMYGAKFGDTPGEEAD